MRKSLDIALALVGLLLALIALSLWQSIGLLLATISSLPGFLMLLYGYSLYSGGGLKRPFGQWLMLSLAMLLAWSVILPYIYQTLLLVAMVIIGTSAVIWYRRKSRKVLERKENEQSGEDCC